jgi:2-iminobutanoate/2-iminopropanoate deaminase
MRSLYLITLFAALTSGAHAHEPAKEGNATEIRHIMAEDMKKLDLPFSSAVEVDGLIFVSGTLGTVPSGELAAGGIGPETRQTMENIKSLLATEGLGMDRLIKCTVMLADIKEWPAFNVIYADYFDSNYPARSAFAASGLALGARVEVECIAKR